MASRFRSISRPVSTLFKQSISKPSSSIPFSSFPIPRSPPSILRPLAQMGALQSLLPLHSAVASARLTSCLGIDSKGSRSLSQGEREVGDDLSSLEVAHADGLPPDIW